MVSMKTIQRRLYKMFRSYDSARSVLLFALVASNGPHERRLGGSRALLAEARLRRPGTAKPRRPKRVRARALLAQRAYRRAKMTARRCGKHANRWAAISVGRLRGTYLLNPASIIGRARRSHVSRTGTLCSCQTSTTEQKRGKSGVSGEHAMWRTAVEHYDSRSAGVT